MEKKNIKKWIERETGTLFSEIKQNGAQLKIMISSERFPKGEASKTHMTISLELR